MPSRRGAFIEQGNTNPSSSMIHHSLTLNLDFNKPLSHGYVSLGKLTLKLFYGFNRWIPGLKIS